MTTAIAAATRGGAGVPGGGGVRTSGRGRLQRTCAPYFWVYGSHVLRPALLEPVHSANANPSTAADVAGPGCRGCGSALPPSHNPGRPREWCSERCRVRTVRAPYVRRRPDGRDASCEACGAAIHQGPTGRLKRFCDWRCQHRGPAAVVPA
jgi:hypothetical protein